MGTTKMLILRKNESALFAILEVPNKGLFIKIFIEF